MYFNQADGFGFIIDDHHPSARGGRIQPVEIQAVGKADLSEYTDVGLIFHRPFLVGVEATLRKKAQ
jgi:hypothetical protein